MAGGPCKPPKTLSETLRIRGGLCKVQHLGRGLFGYFLLRRLWEAFALRLTKPEQRHAVNLDVPEALLPRPWFCCSATSMGNEWSGSPAGLAGKITIGIFESRTPLCHDHTACSRSRLHRDRHIPDSFWR